VLPPVPASGLAVRLSEGGIVIHRAIANAQGAVSKNGAADAAEEAWLFIDGGVAIEGGVFERCEEPAYSFVLAMI
jgi:hypothetical protein